MNNTIECQPLLFNSLSTEQLEPYKQLVIPDALSFFEKIDPEYLLIGIEARLHDRIIGLIVVQFCPSQRSGQIYSLMVEESFRRKGIATFLFKHLQEHLVRHHHCKLMGFNYQAGSEEEAPIEKILARFQWPTPKIYLIRCHFLSDEFNPPWYQSKIEEPKPTGIKIFPLNKLKAPEKKRILYEMDQGMFQANLSPFVEKEIMSPLNSLGVRYKNKVIGWCQTHRVSQDTIRYSALYMEKEFHSIGIWLVSQSIKRQKEHANIYPKALFNVIYEESDLSWWMFVHRHLIPFAKKVEKFKWAIQFFNH
jgi:GNAT superfamily N-acetyltransferase